MSFWTNNRLSAFLIFLIFLLLMLIVNIIGNPKVFAYKTIRALAQIQLDLSTHDFQKLQTGSFKIKYQEIPEESARLVAETGKDIITPVNELLQFTPQEKIPVIIYPSMESLNESFGWEGDKSPMGVYWLGTIRVLAPEAWLGEKDSETRARIFKDMGPMAHEYVHYVVDYKTNGNYTRWFTEGIAQYIEKKITGFSLEEPTEEAKLNIYPFNKLDKDFDRQEDQDLAYWQSLIAVEYLVEKYEEPVITSLLDELGKGKSMAVAFEEVLGMSLHDFEEEVKKYAWNKALGEN